MKTPSGKSELLSVDDESPISAPLRVLIEVTYGPPLIVAEAFGDVTGIREVYLFGAWARRAREIAGPQPHDIDFLVAGDVDGVALASAASEAEKCLRRPVQVVTASVSQWESGKDDFLERVKREPMIRVPGDWKEDSGAAARSGDDSSTDGGWANRLIASVG